MAKYCEEIFGELLLKSPVPECPVSWPSKNHFGGPDSLVVRASALGAVDRGFGPRLRHTKGVKNGTSSSLADARIKG